MSERRGNGVASVIANAFLHRLVQHLLVEPTQLHRRLQRLRRPARLGSLRRTTPLSDSWGYDRGTPVDRYYIEKFLEQYRADIRGHVLEVHDDNYTRRFGHDVERSDILDVDKANSDATIIADLSSPGAVPSGQFDCFILTQTLHLIYDVASAVRNAHHMLRPGGALLATVPAVSKMVQEYGPQNDYWRFTPAGCVPLFENIFGSGQVTVRAYGNVLTAIAFLAGIAWEELKREELDETDERFPVIVTVRAVKQI